MRSVKLAEAMLLKVALGVAAHAAFVTVNTVSCPPGTDRSSGCVPYGPVLIQVTVDDLCKTAVVAVADATRGSCAGWRAQSMCPPHVAGYFLDTAGS